MGGRCRLHGRDRMLGRNSLSPSFQVAEVCVDGASQSCFYVFLQYARDMLPFPGLALSVTDIERSHSFLRYHTLYTLPLTTFPPASSLLVLPLSTHLALLSSLDLPFFLRTRPPLDHAPGERRLSCHEVVEAKSVRSGYSDLLDYRPSRFLISVCMPVCLGAPLLSVWLSICFFGGFFAYVFIPAWTLSYQRAKYDF